MEYIIIFLEGIITFISPCMLPMLPIYLTYFAGKDVQKKNTLHTLLNVLSFILGFTIVFTMLAVFSSSLGMLLKNNMSIVNILLGIVVIFLGLNYMDAIKLNIMNKNIKFNNSTFNILSSFVFGIIFSITWTPCVGAFLGTALSMITINGSILKGIVLMLVYCLGLGIPFILSAFLIDKLKMVFDNIKKHYNIINKICGIFLCIIGILMVTGLIEKYFIYLS